MRSVFVDTSAFVALRNASEAEHASARAALARLIREGAALYTSNYVFAGTFTALLVRVGRGEAIEWGRRFRSGGAIEAVRVDRDVEDQAWEILERHEDKGWSYVDAPSAR
jgi:predicted nucleic acid-binding protein